MRNITNMLPLTFPSRFALLLDKVRKQYLVIRYLHFPAALKGGNAMATHSTTGNVFSITCEGAKASELVKRGGYDWVNSDITDALFPIEPHAPVSRTIELVEFDYDHSSEEVLAEFARCGLERPTYEDALYFGIEYPEKQRECAVVFIHEPVLVCGGRGVLVLDGGDRGRDLFLGWFDGGWGRYYVFAAVRPSARA